MDGMTSLVDNCCGWFQAKTGPPQRIEAGNVILLFPGMWHLYVPDVETDFDDEHCFCRLFRRKTGVRPGESRGKPGAEGGSRRSGPFSAPPSSPPQPRLRGL